VQQIARYSIYLFGNLLKMQRHVEAIITQPLMGDLIKEGKVVPETRSDVGRAGAWAPLSPMSVRPAERQVQSNQPNQEIPP
jgi:hypothetical protein